MIESFKCKDTQALFENKHVARFVNIEQVARRKLKQLHAATDLAFLRIPPQNRLEALKGNRKGNGASASTINGVCVLNGATARRAMSRSWTTTERRQ
jgi:plasmid maintenance system killer protein